MSPYNIREKNVEYLTKWHIYWNVLTVASQTEYKFSRMMIRVMKIDVCHGNFCQILRRWGISKNFSCDIFKHLKDFKIYCLLILLNSSLNHIIYNLTHQILILSCWLLIPETFLPHFQQNIQFSFLIYST